MFRRKDDPTHMIEPAASNPASEDLGEQSQTRESAPTDAQFDPDEKIVQQTARDLKELSDAHLAQTECKPDLPSEENALPSDHPDNHIEPAGIQLNQMHNQEGPPTQEERPLVQKEPPIDQRVRVSQSFDYQADSERTGLSQNPAQSSGGIWKPAAICLALGLTLALGMLIGEHLHGASRSGPGSAALSDKAELDISQLSHAAASAAVPNAIADIVAKVAPSVVTVSLHAPNKNDKQNSFFELPFGAGESVDQASPPMQTSLGTGVIFSPDGYIITSAHVLRPGSVINVSTQDHHIYKADIVGRDVFSDIAVLQVKSSDLPAVRFGDVRYLRPGDWAIAIGSPFGYDYTVTLGVISALSRSVEDANVKSKVDFIQTDAAINPGSSGGPLLNIKGEVIGINAAIRSNASGIGFAIPADEVQKVANELIKHGEIARPYLGVWMEDINPMFQSRFHIPGDISGVQISQTVQGGPFDKAGLGVGDVIQKVDGRTVTSASEVRKFLRSRKPGDEIEIEVWRKGNHQVRKVTIGKYPAAGINVQSSIQK